MTENKSIQRRTVLKGAAWSVPVVAAAAAMPLSGAATSGEPACPSCMKPQLGAFTLAGTAGVAALKPAWHATLAFAAASVIDATDCGSIIGNIFSFQPAFTFIVVSSTLKMSDGSTYNSTVGLAPGAGVLGGVGVMANPFVFNDVVVGHSNPFPQAGTMYTPVSLTVVVNVSYKWGLGATLMCPTTFVWNLPSLPVSVLVGGNGVVTYTGVTTQG